MLGALRSLVSTRKASAASICYEGRLAVEFYRQSHNACKVCRVNQHPLLFRSLAISLARDLSVTGEPSLAAAEGC